MAGWTGSFCGNQTFFLRFAGRDGEESSGRSGTKSLRVESRRARWVRFEGLTILVNMDSRLCEDLEQLQQRQQQHAGCLLVGCKEVIRVSRSEGIAS